MQRKFVIFTMGRSGSSWLCDLLNYHSNIQCFYEIFKNFEKNLSESNTDFIQRVTKSNKSVYGFKILADQMDFESHKQLAQNNEYQKIILKRKNPLHRYISHQLALSSGLWHHDHKLDKDTFIRGIKDILKGKYSLIQILNKLSTSIRKLFERYDESDTGDGEFYLHLDAETVKVEIDRELNFYHDIESLCTGSHKIIYYEDLCQNKEKTLKEILQFLGLEWENLYSSRKKIETMPPSQRIKNFEEIKTALKNTKYESYF